MLAILFRTKLNSTAERVDIEGHEFSQSSTVWIKKKKFTIFW